MAKILLEFVIDAKSGTEQIAKLKEALESVGVSGTKVSEAMNKQEREFKRLIDRLEPARVAQEKLAHQQQVLGEAFSRGDLTFERYRTAMQTLQDQSGRTGGALAQMTTHVKQMLAAWASVEGIRKYLDIMGGTIAEAARAEQTQLKLEAVLRATDNAAGLTAKQIEVMSERIARLDGSDVELVKNAAAVLATFKSVRGEAFERTLAAATDLAAVMETDLQSAVLQLGKALANPETGLTALRRAGVDFTEGQKALIKELMETNHQLEAQAIILNEVSTQTGGAAERMGRSFTGEVNRMKEAIRQFQEELGNGTVESSPFKDEIWFVTQSIRELTDLVKDARREMPDGPVAWVFGKVGISSQSATAGMASWRKQIEEAESLKDNVARIIDAWKGMAQQKDLRDAALVFEAGPGMAAYEEHLKEVAKQQRAAAETLANWNVEAAKFNAATKPRNVEAIYDETKLANAIEEKNEQQKLYNDLLRFAAPAIAQTRRELQGLADQHLEEAKQIRELQESTRLAMGTIRTKEWKELGGQAAAAFSTGLTDGILGSLSGQDFGDAWSGLWRNLWNISAGVLDKVFGGLMSGQGWQDTMQGVGLYQKGAEGQPGQWNYAGIAGLAGGTIWGIGRMKDNRGLQTVGGALTGGAGGYAAAIAMGAKAGSAGGWIGAIIGAVVGAAMAYFGSAGPQKESYRFGLGRAGQGYVYEITGMDRAKELQLQEQITEKYRSTTMAFRDLLKLMGQEPGKLPQIELGMEGKTRDISGLIDGFLKGTLPRAVFGAYQAALGQGLGSLGVGEGRIAEEMAAFSGRDFDAALAAFQRYVQVLVTLRDLRGDLGKILAELQDDVTMGMREAWRKGLDETLDQVKQLSEGLDQLTSEEQVARAEQIAQLTRQQYESNLQYLQQLRQLQIGLNQSFDQMFMGWEEQRIGETGDRGLMAGFYQKNIVALIDQLKNATTAEQVSSLTQQIQGYGGKLWGMGGSWNRQWVETQMREAQRIANEQLDKWQAEVKAANDALLAALGDISTALTNETSVRAELLKSIQDENDARREHRTLLQDTNTYLRNFGENVGALDAAAILLQDALLGASEAARDLGGGLAGAFTNDRTG